MNLLLPLTTVLPIFIYMVGGILLKRMGRLSDGTIAQVNKIIFSYFFPFIMFNNIYHTDLENLLSGRFLITMVGLVLLISLLAVLLVPRFFSPRPVQGSMIQAIIRGNSILFALPVVSAISGPDQLGLASLSVAVVVPLYHLICTVVLEALRGKALSPGKMALSLLKNPLIIGAIAGIVVKALDIRLLPVLEDLVSDVAGMVTPLALLMLGAGLKFSDTVKYRKELITLSVVKLLLIPLLYVLVVKAMGFDRAAVTTALALGAVPTAVSTYVMAIEMDADGPLAGQIVATTSTLSIATVFLWVLVLSELHWIG